MVRLTETFGERAEQREAAVLSDGTLRVLAVAAAVLSVAEGSLVVIEEIDNGVHPSRAKLLLDAIYATAQARKLRVLLTTHNPALADAVPLAAIPDVVANYRATDTGRSCLSRLSDLDDYAALTAQSRRVTICVVPSGAPLRRRWVGDQRATQPPARTRSPS